MNARDEHVHRTVSDALAMTQDLLSSTLPGRLQLFALRTEEKSDHLDIVFVLDAAPDLKYSYSHALYDERHPSLDSGLIVSIVLGALVERVKTWNKAPVDGVVDLNST